MIIGITGTNGAGKGTVVDYLVEKHGFAHFSARGFIVDEIHRRGLPIDRSHMREVANDLRRAMGPAYVIEKLFAAAASTAGNSVIESVRAIAEAEYLHANGALIVAVDADRALRYERIMGRGSSTDQVTFQEFCEQEDREMNGPDAWDMNVFGVMRMAERVLLNEGTQDALFGQIEEFLEHDAR